MDSKIVYFFLFEFSQNKLWAFTQMGRNHRLMKNQKGLIFYKFMGSGGKSGFSLQPDFSTYALVSVWENEEKAESFLKNNELIFKYKEKSKTVRLLILKPFQSHGLWSGINPFKVNNVEPRDKSKVAIITRATLNFSKLISFWKSVPDSSKAISKAKGVYFFKGIGELPFIQQATISLWDSLQDVLNFAYKSKAHAEIVKKTRKEKWYKEELFSRFYIEKDQII
tara:strand:- start:980 stop:1651 length:672 start_codon:yes stop_codon:yes gene_type:complete